MLNSRYLPMGMAVAPDLTGPPLRRLLVGQLVVDESWAVARTHDRMDARRLLGAGLVLYAAWVVGTAAGLLVAEMLPPPEVLGLDAAFPALFLAVLVQGLRSRTDAAARGGSPGLGGVGPCPPSRSRRHRRVRLRRNARPRCPRSRARGRGGCRVAPGAGIGDRRGRRRHTAAFRLLGG